MSYRGEKTVFHEKQDFIESEFLFFPRYWLLVTGCRLLINANFIY